MSPIIYAIPIFLIAIAIEWWWAVKFRGNTIADAGGRTRPIFNFADAMSSLHIGILSRVALAFPRLLTLGIYVLIYDQFATFTWDMQSPLAWVLALLVYDHSYYWSHRSRHEVRLLWATHITHHNSEYFNLSTALRQASTGVFFDWIFYVPLALLGVPWQMFVIVGLIDLLYQFWVHTELIGKMGWFDRVFVSPSNHRVHHGQDHYCIDKNYGGILILWDRLYGTFVEERDQPITYGVRTPLGSLNPVWGNLHDWAGVWHDLKTAKGVAGKLESLFVSPSGWDGEKLGPFNPTVFKRYDVWASIQLKRYVFAQLLLNVILICGFLYFFPKWSAGHAGLAALWMLAALLAPMAWLEGKRWGKWLEWVRWLVAFPLAGWLLGTLK